MTSNPGNLGRYGDDGNYGRMFELQIDDNSFVKPVCVYDVREKEAKKTPISLS